MKYAFELVLAIILLFLLYSKFTYIKLFSETGPGIIFLIVIILLSLKSTIAGLLGVLAFIIISDSDSEGMDNIKSVSGDNVTSTLEEEQTELKTSFIKTHCQPTTGGGWGKLVDDSGDVVELGQIKNKLPQLDFPQYGTSSKERTCDPCDPVCEFSIINSQVSQEDRIKTEEDMRPKDSNLESN